MKIVLALSSIAVLVPRVVAQSAGPIQISPNAQLSAPGSVQLGTVLTLSGDDLLVRGTGGSPRQVVYHRIAGTWSQQAGFDVVDSVFVFPCAGRSTSLSILGDLLVIGVPRNGSLGRAWISQRAGSTWSTPSFVENQDYFDFGQAVLAYGGIVLVGMPDNPFAGSVGMWRKTPMGWEEIAGLSSPPPYHGAMGALLASSGTTLLAAESDQVKVFLQGATLASWTFQALLDPPGDAIVRAMAMNGDVAVLSTENVSGCSTSSPPEVLVYERSGSTWTQTASLVASDAAPPVLGSSLSVSADTIWVGAATFPAGLADGAVYAFQRIGSSWVQVAKLVSSPSLPSQSFFGKSLACDGSTLCVGAPGTSGNPGTIQVFDVAALPPPQAYCTAKVNSQGCLPAIGASGVPGMTNPSPFLLLATNVINQKTGMLLYSTSGAANTPFQGGTLCLAQPLQRTPAQSSGGNLGPDDCSGVYVFDFNVRAQSGTDPALAPGVQVWAQYYSRDPADPFQVGLTDGVAFTLGS